MFALFMLYFVFLHTVHPYASPHVQFMFHSSFVSGISLFCPFCILSVSWVTLFGLYYPAHIMYTVARAGYEISFLARSRFNFREGRVFFRSEKNSKLEKVRLMWQRCRALPSLPLPDPFNLSGIQNSPLTLGIRWTSCQVWGDLHCVQTHLHNPKLFQGHPITDNDIWISLPFPPFPNLIVWVSSGLMILV